MSSKRKEYKVDDDGGELTFTEEQLRRILNIDETELALNGDTHAGSRLAVTFYDPHLPIASRSVAKSSLACTGIFGSNAAGKCVPPHFQLPTSATAEEWEKVRIRRDGWSYTPDTRPHSPSSTTLIMS